LVGAIHTQSPAPEPEKPGLLTTHQLVMKKGQNTFVHKVGSQFVVCGDFPSK
jgi:hypothetical protein